MEAYLIIMDGIRNLSLQCARELLEWLKERQRIMQSGLTSLVWTLLPTHSKLDPAV